MTRKRLLTPFFCLLLCWCALLPTSSAQDILLRYGDNRVDNLVVGAVQDYRFQGAAGDKITIRIADGTAVFDSRLEVFGPDGSLLIGEWDRGGVEFRLNLNLNENGTYRIRVADQGADEGGRYGLSLQKLNSGPAAIALTKGEERQATMRQLGALQAYLFCGAAGDRVQLRMQGLAAAFDSQLELYGPGGALLASGFGNDGTAAAVEVALPADGLYTVLTADSGGTDTGDYTLRLDSDGACNTVGIRPRLCAGQSFIWNGTLYDKNRDSDIRVSGDTVFVVWLDFSAPTRYLTDTLCRSEFLVVNGVRYDAAHPDGREVLVNRSSAGCDSIVEISLVFRDTVVSQWRQTLCASESITVNGTVYDRNRPSGRELIAGGSAGGCDSLVEISLSFLPPARGVLEEVLCPGASFSFDGVVYDEMNPAGVALLPGVAAGGCDSLVEVRLSFHPPAVGELRRTLCPGASLTVNGTVYDETNPGGTEILPGASVNGCDSVVQVQLSFDGPVIGRIEETLCPGASLTINGRVYDARNPMGTEIIPGTAVGGCDSLVEVRLSFFPPATGTLEETLCPGETVLVNGTEYSRDNPSGVEIIPGGAVSGCDSVVQVRLTYLTGAVGTVEELLCPDEFIRVNGTIYDRLNPAGTEVISGAAPDGCDSVIQVRLSFYPEATRMVEELLCPDEFIRVNGTIYDRLNPAGTEIIPGVAANGCDSVVQVRLRFLPEARGRLEQTLCPDEFITLNGTVYDRFNPTGTAIIPGAAANGCDSVVQVRLNFHAGGVGAVQATLCPGEELEVNGALYDQLNPMGTEIIPGGAVSGCDSLVEVQLDFYPEATGLLEQRLCPGESLLVNGTEYNEFNPEGAELLRGAAANGCDSTLQIRLTFDTICDVSVDFFIPGGITPNGDGLNDRFVIPAIDANPAFFDNSQLIVSNRWGQVVYEAVPYQNDWSGDNGDGTPLPAGTYFYRFLYGPERETLRRGEVTIMR